MLRGRSWGASLTRAAWFGWGLQAAEQAWGRGQPEDALWKAAGAGDLAKCTRLLKLLDVLPEVATKAAERAVRAVMLPLLCSLPCSSPANEGNASAHLCTGPSAKRVGVVGLPAD